VSNFPLQWVVVAKTRRRYGWALRIPYGDRRLRGLSSEARAGLEYARRLARNAQERREEALFTRRLPERLTVQEIAREEETSPFEIYRLIKWARIELFGRDVSDSAAYRRLREAVKEDRVCAEPGCSNLLPLNASRARRYCLAHSRGAARVRRHRRRASSQS
jgi:hypothetical protein